MTSKKTKKQQEELPSFLLNLNQKKSEFALPTKETSIDNYLGPLFFGECLQHHPPHVIPRERLPLPIFTTISEQEIIENMFVEPDTDKKDFKTRESSFQKRHHIARQRQISEPPVPRYRGVRKVFVPEVRKHQVMPSHEVDLGETESEISGEMCREIPVCRVKSCSSICEQYETVNLSDIREENRPFMPYNERIAHAHFLKEFVTVTIVGPKIPAAITIKKLPTKRKTLSDFYLQSQPKKTKPEKEREEGEDVREEIVKEEENEEAEDDRSIKELLKPTPMEDDTFDEVDETPSGMISRENGYEEDIHVMKEEEDRSIDHVGEHTKSSPSIKQELEGELEGIGQVETEEEGEEILEDEISIKREEVEELK